MQYCTIVEHPKFGVGRVVSYEPYDEKGQQYVQVKWDDGRAFPVRVSSLSVYTVKGD